MSEITRDMVTRISPNKVEVGDELMTATDTAIVGKIGYTDDINRIGWKFEMSDGTTMEFGHSTEKVTKITRTHEHDPRDCRECSEKYGVVYYGK
jgi:hypothetical protein